MVLVAADCDFAGIWCTQVGDPLAHCQEGVRHCASADRATGLAVGAIAHSEDEEVGEPDVLGYIAEGVVHAMLVTEFAP